MHDVGMAYYQQSLKIDKNNLDEMLIEQPQLFNDVSEQAALATSRADQAKDDLKRTEARLFMQTRRKFMDNNEKATEAVINAAVTKHSKRKEAYTAWIEAQREASEWDALKGSFLQRSFVLRDLCGLYISGYYGESSVAGSTRKMDDAQHESRVDAMNKAREKAREKKSRRKKLSE